MRAVGYKLDYRWNIYIETVSLRVHFSFIKVDQVVKVDDSHRPGQPGDVATLAGESTDLEALQ